MMGILLRLVVGVFMLGVAVSVARSMGYMVIRLAKAVLLGIFTVVAAILSGIVAGSAAAELDWNYPGQLGTMVGIAVFVAILYFARRSRSSEPDTGEVRGDVCAAGEDALREPVASQETDSLLAMAWENALQLAPHDRQRVRVARAACARMVELAEGGLLDPALIDCAAFTRRTVPELVSTTQAVLVDADPAERAQLLVGLVEDLEAIGRRAAAEVQRIGSPLRDKHAALRAHVAMQAGRP